ncbi:helix-turn-helix transcriptional regulator [Novosphingobium sp. BL-52-GroH]|uniref:helix-turn-helix transcriptional regulator n=1 Tax=Novosphingobium sp. BL-52-GroH TaxID=3349877 RepID=UPI00384BFBB2
MTDNAPDRILRLNAVLDRTGLSPATLYREIQGGPFLRQLRIAPRKFDWQQSVALKRWKKTAPSSSV